MHTRFEKSAEQVRKKWNDEISLKLPQKFEKSDKSNFAKMAKKSKKFEKSEKSNFAKMAKKVVKVFTKFVKVEMKCENK